MQLWGKVVEGMILISKEFDVEVDARDNLRSQNRQQ